MSLTIKQLLQTIPQTGKVNWIGTRPGKRAELQSVPEVLAIAGSGLEGDHYGKQGGNRQVTLIQAEHLQGVASILGKEAIDPGLTRRNIVIEGINLHAFKKNLMLIGEEVVLEITGDCHPCTRMEENLGPGGYQAMRAHGGLTAKVLIGGKIQLGDPVRFQVKKAEAEKA